jgi:metal-responsive CopG/Arc/MetJ family transcriptional regulator
MARLPSKEMPKKHQAQLITSVSISPEMDKMLREEQVRVGAKSRSELIRLILEEYFKQEI